MSVFSRPMAFLFLEVGNLLGVLMLAESPLGTDLSAGAAAALLVAMAVVILAVTASRRLQPLLPWVEWIVGGAMIVVAVSSWLATPALALKAGLAVFCGGTIVYSGWARQRMASNEPAVTS